MNEAMSVSRQGLKLIMGFEGPPRLTARRCEGGAWELSYGCTTWPDGRPVKEGDTCTEDEALQLFAFHIQRFEGYVEKYVTVPLNQHQYDAHVSFAYNVGEEQYRTSTVVEMTNEKNWDAAAEAFGRFQWATSPGPSAAQLRSQKFRNEHKDIIGADGFWKGPDGQRCEYRQALMGLLRRHHSEGLNSLSMPWESVTTETFVYIEAERHWNASKNRWEDLVMDFRKFADCRRKAEVLPPLPLPEPVKPVEAKPPPAATTPAAAPAKPAPASPNAPAPQPRPPLEYQVPKGLPTPPIPPPAKPLEQTRRFWGAVLYYGGKLVMAFGVSTAPGHLAVWFGEVWGATVKDPVLFGMAIDTLTFSSGWAMDHCGAWIRKWGERRAKGPIVSGGEAHHSVLAQTSTQTALVTTQTATVAVGS